MHVDEQSGATELRITLPEGVSAELSPVGLVFSLPDDDPTTIAALAAELGAAADALLARNRRKLPKGW